MKLALIGYGKMGRMVEEVAARQSIEVACVLNRVGVVRGQLADCNVAIEFSEPSAVLDNLKQAADALLAVVIGTTGWYDKLEEARRIVEASALGCVYGSNFSIGVNLMFKLVRLAAQIIARHESYDPFIQEAHHRFKKDAPSGTAISLARIIEDPYNRSISIASTRAGHIPGTHVVGFDSDADTLSITHTARSRAGFAEGALVAARWIAGRQGFYEFSDIITDDFEF